MQNINAYQEFCHPSSEITFEPGHLRDISNEMEVFQDSNVYTHEASSESPWKTTDCEIMVNNVKSSARRNLFDPEYDGDDEGIISLATHDVRENKSTQKPAILLQKIGGFIKSIGRISCGNKVGTCWLISDTLIITCHHVYRMFIKERNDTLNPDLPIEVSFDHFYPGQPDDRQKVVVDGEHKPPVESSGLDYIFLSLKKPNSLGNREGLGKIVRNRSLQEGLVIIVGHPAGNEMFEETCVVVRGHLRERLEERQNSVGLHMTSEDRLRAKQYEEQGCLPYDTTLFYGSSGSPVFDCSGNIVAMHAQGYKLDIPQKREVCLMEFGVQFSAICEDLRRRNFDVKEYFPDYDLGLGEERMDEDDNR